MRGDKCGESMFVKCVLCMLDLYLAFGMLISGAKWNLLIYRTASKFVAK